jgi:hypothetical protein
VLVARRRRGRRALWLLVPAISYYVSVLSVLGKPDDRYLLGIWAIAAVFGGVAAGALLGRPVRLRVAGPVVVAGGMLYATLYSGTINVMMTRDARATAERFLQAEVSPFGSLGMIGLREYLPRVGGRRAVELEPTPESLEVHAPTFICLNVLHLTRYAHHPDWGPYLQELTAGRLGYEVVFDERSAPPWWALAGRLDIFADDEESRLTNLDKVGARIMILRRES